jgi:hypothetical protein
MAQQTPPPYIDVTGLYVEDPKHVKTDLAGYDGNASPGQLVVDTATYNLYVGNALGNLNLVGGGGGGGNPAGPFNSLQFNNAGAFGGSANLTFANGNLNVGGDIMPLANNVSNIGSPTLQFKDMYLSNATIYFNNIPLSVDANDVLQFNGVDLISAGVINTGDIETQSSFIGANFVISNATTGGSLTFADGTIQTTAPVVYDNANVADYLPTYTGNLSAGNIALLGAVSQIEGAGTIAILPSAGNTVDLGDTRLLGDITPVNAEGGNIGTPTLPFFSSQFVNVNSVSVTATGNISGLNISATGNVTAAHLIGEAGNLSNVTASNVVGTVANAAFATVSASTDSVLGANVSGEVSVANTVSNPLQPAITQVGTLTGLTVGTIDITGQLTANANAQFNGDVFFAGNVSIPGTINQISGNSGQFFGEAATGFGALYAGLSAGYTLLNQEITQFAASFNGYTQVSIRNISGGDQSTGDFVVTADNGSDTTNFVNLGFTGSGYSGLQANNSLGTSVSTNDGYLYAQGDGGVGGNLVIGSNEVGGVVRIIANGESDIGNVVATFAASGLNLNRGNLTLPGNTFSVNYANGTAVQLGIAENVVTIASASTIAPTSTTTQYNVTALAEAAAVAEPTGTPTDGAKLVFRILDNGTAQALTWNAVYQPIGVILPTTTVVSKYLYVGCIYNAQSTTWDVVSVAQQG